MGICLGGREARPGGRPGRGLMTVFRDGRTTEPCDGAAEPKQAWHPLLLCIACPFFNPYHTRHPRGLPSA